MCWRGDAEPPADVVISDFFKLRGDICLVGENLYSHCDERLARGDTDSLYRPNNHEHVRRHSERGRLLHLISRRFEYDSDFRAVLITKILSSEIPDRWL